MTAATAPGVEVRARITHPDGTTEELPAVSSDANGNVQVTWDSSSLGLADVSYGLLTDPTRYHGYYAYEYGSQGTWFGGGTQIFYVLPSFTTLPPNPVEITGLSPSWFGSGGIMPNSQVSFVGLKAQPGTTVSLTLYHLNPSTLAWETPYTLEDKVVDAEGNAASWNWTVPATGSVGRWAIMITATQAGVSKTSVGTFDVSAIPPPTATPPVGTGGGLGPLTITELLPFNGLQHVSITSPMKAGGVAHLLLAFTGYSDVIDDSPLLVKGTVHYPSGKTLELPPKVTDGYGKVEWDWQVATDVGTGKGYVDVDNYSQQTKVWFKVD